MSDKLDKVLQIRLSSREQEMIKRAFVGTIVSNMVRMYLITEAEKILEIYGYYIENTAITYEYEIPTLE